MLRQTQPARRPSAPHAPLAGLGSLIPPPATCLLVGRGWGRGGNLESVFPDTQLCVCRPTWPLEPWAAAWLRRGGCGLPSCGQGARPPVCTHRRRWAPGQPHGISPALGVGRGAQGNELAEISRASYLPTQASSHKSQNRVPGRDVNSEMQRQLQRKTVESDPQESCLLSPQVSEGSLEQARARRGHCSQSHPQPPNRRKVTPRGDVESCSQSSQKRQGTFSFGEKHICIFSALPGSSFLSLTESPPITAVSHPSPLCPFGFLLF